MIDMIKNNLGPILLGVIVAVPLVQMVVSLLLRKTRRRLVAAVDGVLNAGPLTRPDRVWLRNEIDTSTGNHSLIASFFAPFAIFAAVALGIYEGSRARRKTKRPSESLADRFKNISADWEASRSGLENAEAKAVLLSEGVDPHKGKLWNDPRGREIKDISFTLGTWSHPIAVVWIFLWVLAAVPFVIVGYAISGTIAPFLTNLWHPLRNVMIGTLRSHRA